MKAVEQKPDFDIALANLGNAIKDVGRPWDAIAYYRRAARADPTLPEAVCGLVNSLSSICDWHGRGAVAGEVGVDDGGFVIPPGAAPADGLDHEHDRGHGRADRAGVCPRGGRARAGGGDGGVSARAGGGAGACGYTRGAGDVAGTV